MNESNDLIKKEEVTTTVEHVDLDVSSPGILITVLSFSLLLAPLILGMHINTLGNVVPIGARIAIQLNLNNTSNLDTDTLFKLVPKSYWSIGALYPIGGMVGALTSSSLSDKLGRKKSTYIYLFSTIFGTILKLASYSSHFAIMFIGRFFDGIGSAGIMVTVIILMFEIQTQAQTKYSKPLVQITINLGIFLYAVLSLKQVFGNNFIHLYYIPAIACVAIFLVLQYLPESPVWLFLVKNDEAECVKALKKIHGSNFNSALLELKQQKKKKETDGQVKALTMTECFQSKRFRGALISVVLLNAAQQLSGINAIMAFAPTILENMNVGDPQLFSLIILGSALFGSFIFAPLVSTWKRKRSLLIGHSIMAICLIGQLITFYSKGPNILQLFFLAFFVFIFQIGPGPLLWFLCVEVFTNDVVGAAQSIGVSANWISNSLVFAIASLDMGVLGFFAIVNVFITVFMLFFVSETLGRTPNDILDSYQDRYKKCF